MSGERDLSWLLAGMRPLLQDGTYVFCTLPRGRSALDLDPVATVREAEGLSVVVEEAAAQRAGLACDYPAAWITLTVHSDLAAVGFLAAIAAAMTDAGITCNAVAGARHDHLFVPHHRAADAMAVLRSVAATAPPG